MKIRGRRVLFNDFPGLPGDVGRDTNIKYSLRRDLVLYKTLCIINACSVELEDMRALRRLPFSFRGKAVFC